MGMMPHPERATEPLMGSTDGLVVFESMLRRGGAAHEHDGASRPDLIAQHQLTAGEYQKIVAILGREPSYTELGIFSVMWSEHCSYKSSRLHLKKLPTRGKLVVQGPGENAGIIDIGGGYVIAFKIESHNHPSFIEPFQGAATGVGGILRDIFTMGARPIAVMDSLRFGPPGRSGDRRAQPAHPRRAWSPASRITATASACPRWAARCIFEPCYNGNPLVNVFALGVCRKEDDLLRQGRGRRQSGDLRGRAAPAATASTARPWPAPSSPRNPSRSGPTCRWAIRSWKSCCSKPASKRCRPARSSAFRTWARPGSPAPPARWAAAARSGIEIELDRVPQRETGMTPYEIMLSESQERMLLVADKGREDEVFRVFRKWGLDAVEIGVVTGDGKLRVRHHGEVVAEIPNRELADEAPLYDRPHTTPLRRVPMRRRRRCQPPIVQDDLPTLLASADICSKRWIWEQYDYMVRTNTLAGPGRPMPPSSASRRPAQRSRCRSTATAATAISRRAKARSWPWPNAAAIFRRWARCPWPPPTA